MSQDHSSNGQHNPPATSDMVIAGDALQAYLNAPDGVDRFLFRAFTPDNVAALKEKITTPAALSRNDWDQLSLFLRSVALTLDPFPDLEKRYTQKALYDSIDRIADYALNLPLADTVETRAPQQKRGPGP